MAWLYDGTMQVVTLAGEIRVDDGELLLLSLVRVLRAQPAPVVSVALASIDGTPRRGSRVVHDRLAWVVAHGCRPRYESIAVWRKCPVTSARATACRVSSARDRSHSPSSVPERLATRDSRVRKVIVMGGSGCTARGWWCDTGGGSRLTALTGEKRVARVAELADLGSVERPQDVGAEHGTDEQRIGDGLDF
jgi:hypothetical protein